MSGKNIARIILSLLGLSIGILIIIGFVNREAPSYVFAGGGAAVSILSVGWLLNATWAKIITGLLLIPIGLAGSLWTIWDFIQDVLYDKGVIGNFQLLGYGMTIFLVPYLVVLGVFIWILVKGFELVKRK
jgi:hypothetical protein